MREHNVEKSRHVKALRYDPGNRQLCVEFKNGSHHSFTGVPEEVYEQMCGSSSVGKFFHNVIKLHYKKMNDDDSS